MASVCGNFLAFLFLLKSSFLYFGHVFSKTIIPLALVGYEKIIANSALRASLTIYHLISNVRSWNNIVNYCTVILYHFVFFKVQVAFQKNHGVFPEINSNDCREIKTCYQTIHDLKKATCYWMWVSYSSLQKSNVVWTEGIITNAYVMFLGKEWKHVERSALCSIDFSQSGCSFQCYFAMLQCNSTILISSLLVREPCNSWSIVQINTLFQLAVVLH